MADRGALAGLVQHQTERYRSSQPTMDSMNSELLEQNWRKDTERGQAPPCPVCGSVAVTVFMEIPEVPTLCNALWATREEALRVSRGALQLGFCEDCTHIYNYAFDPDRIEYSQAYENSLHFSPRFQHYANASADRLVDIYGLHGKRIIEIGCGKGDFLRSLCEKGGNTGVGFDPSYEPDLTDDASAEPFTVIRDFYSERYAGYQADLICCRHVLEHIQDPRSFMSTVRRAVGDQVDAALFFEVPNVLFTLRDLAIWDLIYEHCSYFSPASLARLFALCGFHVQRIAEAYEGQFLCIEAFPNKASTGAMQGNSGITQNLQQDVETFARRYEAKIESWYQSLNRIKKAGQRAVIWGAGSKGIMISNILQLNDQIEYVVDINPRKHGMYIAGTGQRIVPPAFLRGYQPDVVIVMNGIYEHEIRQFAHDLGLAPDFLLA